MSEFTSDAVIGLEVHIQLCTKSKLFCACPAFGDETPNTRVCPTCLGMPGSKPVLNKLALEYAMKLALALEASVSQKTVFSRKIYFYPDLAKNFQITQYDAPLAIGGRMVLAAGKEVRFMRLHVEEDPAALVHHPQGCYVDYNRSGIPLVELVTRPDMTSPAEAREFMKKLLIVLKYLGIFNQDACVVKADVNVSVRRTGYTRVEIKNITGFKEIERAINYEVARQQQETVVQETRMWNAETGVTMPMRKKETEEDYGYINDPDLPAFIIDDGWKARIKESIPELAHERHRRFVAEYKIDSTDAHVITSHAKAFADMFERFAKKVNDPKFVAHWFRRDLLRLFNEKPEVAVLESRLLAILEALHGKRITAHTSQRLMERLAEDEDFDPVVAIGNAQAVGDADMLRKLCQEAIDENPQAVKDYAAGETKSLNFLIGKVMHKTKGQAEPGTLARLMKELLG